LQTTVWQSKKELRRRKMKKFSWIFALILALSIGFIGCPSDGGGEEEGGNGGNGGNGGFNYSKNPDAQDISVTFGAAQTVIKKDGNNDGAIDPGTLTYITGGYEYTYGTGNNTNYGNAILRFKVTLAPDINLADYGKVSFDWQATLPAFSNNNSVNSNKNLFLMATDNEADITPWKEPKSKIVSTNVFKDDPGLAFYDGAVRTNDPKVPQVNGLGVHHIEMPIIASEALTYFEGDVWFTIYVHAESGKYQIKNVKFWAGDQTLNCDPPGESAPPQPPEIADIPADFVEIALDLSVSNCNTAGTAEVNATLPELTAAGSGIKAVFSDGTDDQRLNIKLSADDIAAFQANANNKDVYVQIGYTIDGTADAEGKYAGDSFRYHVGKIDSSSNWNATDSLNAFALKDIAVSTTGKGVKINASNKDRAAYFIIQHRSATPITVTFSKVSLWVAPAPTTPEKVMTFAADDVKAKNAAVTLLEGDDAGKGYKVVTEAGYDWTWTYFKVTFEDGYKLSDYKKIDYTIKGITASAPEDWGEDESEQEDGEPKAPDLTGYKPGYMYVYPSDTAIEAITGAIPDTNVIFSESAGGSATGVQNLDTEYSRTVTIKTTLPEDTDAQEIWIAFRCGGDRGYTFELKNIKFYE
jgi:hypothetical protein